MTRRELKAPRRAASLWLGLLVILVGLVAAPLLVSGPAGLDIAVRICVLIVLVASFDLIIGFAGLVSFAHVLCFACGAYGVALASLHLGRGVEALAVGAAAGAGVAALLALVLGALCRGRSASFAMLTLIISIAATGLVVHLAHLTGGIYGLSFRIPRDLTAAVSYGAFPDLRGPLAAIANGQPFTGATLTYYLILSTSCVLLLFMRHLGMSSFGRRLRRRCAGLTDADAGSGCSPVPRLVMTGIASAIAALAGALFAIWFQTVTPQTTLGFDLTLTLLLMLVLGGIGTVHGAVFGVTVVVLAQSHAGDLLDLVSQGAADLPVVPLLLAPERGSLWLALLLLVCINVAPSGVAGRLRGRD